jgi:hypothetical protein
VSSEVTGLLSSDQFGSKPFRAQFPLLQVVSYFREFKFEEQEVFFEKYLAASYSNCFTAKQFGPSAQGSRCAYPGLQN